MAFELKEINPSSIFQEKENEKEKEKEINQFDQSSSSTLFFPEQYQNYESIYSEITDTEIPQDINREPENCAEASASYIAYTYNANFENMLYIAMANNINLVDLCGNCKRWVPNLVGAYVKLVK